MISGTNFIEIYRFYPDTPSTDNRQYRLSVPQAAHFCDTFDTTTLEKIARQAGAQIDGELAQKQHKEYLANRHRHQRSRSLRSQASTLNDDQSPPGTPRLKKTANKSILQRVETAETAREGTVGEELTLVASGAIGEGEGGLGVTPPSPVARVFE